MQHFILPIDLKQSQVTLSDRDLLHQMKQVLRFKKGDKFILMDGRGQHCPAELLEFHKKGAVLSLGEAQFTAPPQRRLQLAIALSKKPSTFELIVQKATELGVTEILPLRTERTQWQELRKNDRLHLIIKEACEQSERAYLPELHEVQHLEDLEWSGPILVGDAREPEVQLRETQKDGNICLVIGPEGGLSAQELHNLKEKGAQIFSMGEGVLRMETAAIAALSVLQFG